MGYLWVGADVVGTGCDTIEVCRKYIKE